MSAIRSRGLNLVSTLVRSVMLARLQASVGNPEAVNQWEDGEQHLSSDVLRRVAKLYLTPANRVVLTVMPGGAQ